MKPDSPSTNSLDQKSSSIFLPVPPELKESMPASEWDILMQAQEIARQLEEAAQIREK